MAEGRGSGKWAMPGVPHKGWACTGFEDLGEPSATCKMCETQEIRYVHHMEHPAYPGGLGVGCVCAGHMEADHEGARRRELSLKASGRRRATWLGRKWRCSAAGNDYLNADGYNVVIYERVDGPKGPAWGFAITNRATSARVPSRRSYRSSDEAKLAAFDGILWLKERGR